MAISHVLAAAMVVVGAAVPVTFPPAQDPSLAPLATGKASFNWIPASDPSIEYVGRTFINPDGTRTFDWEGTQIKINVNNSNWVSAVILATGDALGRFIVETNGWETYSFYAAANTVPNNTYMIADQLWATQSIRLINVLEPSFTGAQSRGSNFTFVGFWTNGQATPPTPRTRKIELVGDSISAGYGARGYANPPYGCPVAGMTSGNYYSYNWALAEAFSADLIPIAWSGKGMYENCCDNGETMPSYYLQTLGGNAYSTDWDFSRYVPDMMLINLGTNDFGHDSGPAWEANFTATYIQFVQNATARYQQPKLPIFVAQGPMDCGAPLNRSLQNAIAGINAAGGNAVYVDLCGPPNDGCGGHPGVLGHRGMFELAQPVIAAVMGW